MKKTRFSTVVAFLLAILLLTACGSSEAAEPAPAAEEAASETTIPAEETPAEEEPAPLTADLITYEDVLDDTDLLDGETVALHATSDLVVMPSIVCYDMFGVTEELQQKATITDDVHMVGMVIDNKTDRLLYPVACPGSLTVNGQSVADERFALLTVNTIFAGIDVVSEESVDPGDSSSMVFFLLAGEELLPELTGMDHVETVEFAFDLLDEAGSVVDTVNVAMDASRPLTEEEIAAADAPVPVDVPAPAAGDNLDGVVELTPTIDRPHSYETDTGVAWKVGAMKIRNLTDKKCILFFDPIAVNGIDISRLSIGVDAGAEKYIYLIFEDAEFAPLGLTADDEIESMTAKLEIYFLDSGDVMDSTPVVSIDEYSFK